MRQKENSKILSIKLKNIQQKVHKLGVFVHDHFHLLFASAANNHLRIQRLQSVEKENYQDIKFTSYTALKRYQKKLRLNTTLGASVGLILASFIALPMILHPNSSKAAGGPTISAITPNNGSVLGGTNITISGTNLNTGIDANTKLLLHADGSGTNFVDSESTPKTITVNGGASQTTSQTKFGGSSMYFNGSNYLSVGSSDFNFGTNDFTIDFWEKSTGSSAKGMFGFGPWTSAGSSLSYVDWPSGQGLSFYTWGYSGSTPLLQTTSTYDDNNWHHVAIVRSGNNFYLFADGILKTSTTFSGSVGTNTFYIGLDGGTTYFTGYIDEFRVSNIARWTSNFTPPAAAYGIPNVTFGGLIASNIATTGSTTLTATTPAHASGVVDLQVTSYDGQSATLTNGYTYNPPPPPSTSSISPSSGPTSGGTSVTISGSNFSAPDSYTSLLLHGDGNFANFIDSSSSPKTVSVTGAVTQSTTQSKFGGKSTYLDGSSNLSVANSSDLNFGTGDFTVDWWEYRQSNGTYDNTALLMNSGAANPNMFAYDINSGGSLGLYLSSNGSSWDIANGAVMGTKAYNTWVHRAVVRSGNTITAYENGVSKVTITTSAAIYYDATKTLKVAGTYNGPAFAGYIDELSVSKGIARWTSNFTPPSSAYFMPPTITLGGSSAINVLATSSSALTAFTPAHASGAADVVVTNPDNQSSTLSSGYTFVAPPAPIVSSISPVGGPIAGGTNVTISGSNFSFPDSYTSLLLHGDNNGSSFVDSSYSPKTLAANGSSTQSNTQVKFGAKSIYLDGTANTTISTPNNADFNFGTGDFTVDWWEYRLNNGSYGEVPIVINNSDGSSNAPQMFGYDMNNGTLTLFLSSNGSTWDIANAKVIGTKTFNAWVHRAVVREGNNFSAYENGVLTASFTSSAPIYYDAAKNLKIGGFYNVGYFNGYLDEVSISKGIARWHTAFTPPTSPYFLPTVSLGAAQATNVVVANSGTITATTPAHASGAVNVVVANPDSQAGTLTNGYTFAGAPIISGVSPASGSMSGGDTVVISGTGFSATPTVKFGTTNAASVTFVNSTTLSVVIPAHSVGQVDVQVINPDLQSTTLSNGFTFNDLPPIISSINPNNGPVAGGTNVTISGSNFAAPDSYTSLLIHSDGSGSSFIDSSYSPKIISSSGSATQSASQAKFGGKSAYFDGSSYLSVANSSDLNFGSGDFTVDWWEYRTSAADYGTIVARDTSSVPGFIIGYANAGVEGVYMSSNGASWDIASMKSLGSEVLNNWSHLAVVRSGNNFYTFRDGTLIDSWTSSASIFASSNPMIIGKYNVQAALAAYVDEFRISKGIARWTSNFTAPTAPYFQPTVFLGGTQATNVNTTSSTTLTATTAAHASGQVDVTVANPDSQSVTLANAYTYNVPPTISGVSPASGSMSGGDTVVISGTGFSATPTVKFGTTNAASVTFVNSTTLSVVIPAHAVGSVGVQVINPDSQNVTLSNGFNFLGLPPAVTSISPNNGPISGGTNVTISGSDFAIPDSYTSLLLHADGSGNSFVDSSYSPKALTANGAVAQSATQSKFGGESAYFDVSSTITTPGSTDFNFGSGDFTIDAWIYPTTVSGWQTIAAQLGSGAADRAFTLQLNGSVLSFGYSTVSSSGFDGTFSGSAAVTINTWNHIALVRSGNTLKYYINGTADPNTATLSAALRSSTSTFGVGSSTIGSEYFHGYIDELRVSKGIARWTSNFTAPTAPYFQPTVFLGGTQATNVNTTSSTTLTATTPAHASGQVDAIVTNTDSQTATLTNGYTYNPPPTVSSVGSSPTNNQNAIGLLINGSDFQNGATIKFKKIGQSDIACSVVSFVNSSQLTCDADFHGAAGGTWDVLVTNPDGQIAIGEGKLTVRDVLVAKYVFIQKPTVLNETEIGTFTVQAQNQNGDAILVDSDKAVSLATSAPTTGFFATDLSEDLSTRWDKTTVTIPTGQSSTTFYYKDTLKGTHTVSANQQSGGTTAATFALPITSKYRLLVTGVSDPIQAGVPSSVTIQAIDYLGNTVADYNGTIHFASADISAAVPANSAISSAQFSTKTFVNGVTMMTQGEQCVTATDVSDANITGSQCAITVTAPPAGVAIKLKFITPPQYVPATTVSTPITVQLQDLNNNPGTKGQATTIYIYKTSGTGQLSADGSTGWTSGAFSVNIPAGATSATFFYKDAALGNFTLTAADDAIQGQDLNLTNDTQALSVVVGSAYSFFFNSAFTTIAAGSTSGILNVSLHDIAGNQVTSVINQNVYITSSSGAQFSLDGATNWTTKLSTTIGTGSFDKNFYYRAPNISGGDVITISDADPANGNTGLHDATQNVTATSSGVTQFAFATSSVSQIAGQKSQTVTIEAKDVFGNVANVASNTSVYLYSNDANTKFFDPINQNIQIDHITIGAGTSAASFVFSQNSNISSVILTASDNSSAPDGATGAADATQTETIAPGSVSKFAFASDSANTANAGDESGVIRVESENTYGVKIPVLVNKEIYFFTDSAGATKEFSLQNGSNWSAVTHATLTSGSDTLNLYYKDSQAGAHTLAAGDDSQGGVDNGLTNAEMTFNVAALNASKLKLLSIPNNLQAGQTSEAITIQLEDQYGNAANVLTDTVVSITSSDANGYITNDGGAQVAAATILAGSNSATFHYRNNAAGSQNITIEASGLTGDSQELTVVWGAPTTLKFNVASSNLVAGSPSGTISVETYNAYNIKAKTDSPTTVNLTSGGAEGKFDTLANGAFNGSVTIVTIGANTDNATFYYKDTLSGNVTVTAASTGLTSANQNFTVAGASADHFAFTSAPQLIPAGNTSNVITVKAYDDFNNETNVSNDTLITLSTTSSNANFSLAASPWNNISTFNLAAGQGAFAFYYKDQNIGSSVITLSSSLPALSQTENIIDGNLGAGIPAKLLFQSAAKTGIINTSFDVNFFLANNSNQYVVAQGPVNVTVISDSATGQFYDANSSSWQNSITISFIAGESVKTLTYRDSATGNPIITLSATGLTSASQQESIINGVISKITLQTANGLTTDRIPVTIKTQTSDNLPVGVTSDTGFVLTQDGTGSFYKYSGDIDPVSSATMLAGNSQTTVYYQQKVPGTVHLSADESPSQGWAAGNATITIAAQGTHLVFTSSSQTKTAGVESDIMTVKLEDAYGNIVAAPNDITLHLSSTSMFGEFSLDNGSNWSATNALTLGSGSSSVSFYYKDTAAGIQTITASDVSVPAEIPDSGIVNATQAFHVTPAAVYSLNFVNAPQNLQYGQTSGVLTVEARDVYGNVTAVSNDLPIYLTTTSANGKFSNSGDFSAPNLITSTKITQGLSNVSFYYQDFETGSPVIVATDKNPLDNPDQGLLNAQQSFTIVPGAITRLMWQTLPTQVEAGSATSAMVIKTTNSYGAELPVASDLNVYFSSTSSAGFFALDANGPWNVTTATIPTGSSRITFHYKDTIAALQAPLIVVSDVSTPYEVPDTGIANAGAYITVNPGAITQITFLSNPQTITANHTSDVFQIQTKNVSGVVTKVTQDTLLYLRSSSQGGEFSSDGITWGVNAITIAQNTSNAAFYYRDWLSGTPKITVSDVLPIIPDQGWTNATQNETINAQTVDHFTVRNISDPQSQGTPSSVVVSPVDAEGYVVKEYAGTITSFVALNGSGNPETDMLPSSYIFDPLVDRGVKTFTNSVAFLSTGEKSVVVADANGKTGSQQNITVTAASAQPLAKIKFIDPISPLAVVKNVASSLITVQMQDASNNPVNAGSGGYPVRIVATSGSAQFSDDGSNWHDGEIVLNVPQNLNFATFYYRNSKSEDDTLTAMDWATNVDDGAISNDAFDVSVAPGIPSHFELSGNTAQVAGSGQTLTITAKDNDGDTAPSYQGDKQITLSGADIALSGDKPVCKDASNNDVEFGSAMTLNFTNGVATCRMKLFSAQTAQINANDGTINSLAKNSYSLLVDVSAAALDGDNSIINVIPAPQKVGALVTANVDGKDKYLNLISKAGDTLTLNVNGANSINNQNMNFDAVSKKYQTSYLAQSAGVDFVSVKVGSENIKHDSDGTNDGIFHEIIEPSTNADNSASCNYIDFSSAKSSDREEIFDVCVASSKEVNSNDLSKSQFKNTFNRRLKIIAEDGNSGNISKEVKIKSYAQKPSGADFSADWEDASKYARYLYLNVSADSDEKMFKSSSLRIVIADEWIKVNNAENIIIVHERNGKQQQLEVKKVESLADSEVYETSVDGISGYYSIIGQKTLISPVVNDQKVTTSIDADNNDQTLTNNDGATQQNNASSSVILDLFEQDENDNQSSSAKSLQVTIEKLFDLNPAEASKALSVVANVSTGIAAVSAGAAAAASFPMLSQILGSMRAMSAVSYRRKQKWGIVYDSETGKPLADCIVTIMDEEEKIKEIKNTDRYGFYFFLVKGGHYQIAARKDGYKMVSDAEFVDFHTYYDNSYQAGKIIEANDDEIISVNIPMQKVQEGEIEKIFNRSVLLHLIFWGGFIFSIGALILHPSYWNAAIMIFFVGNFIFTSLYGNMLRSGKVVTPSGSGVPFATVKIFDIANHNLIGRTIANEHGNFVLVLNEGEYQLEVNNGILHRVEPLTMSKRQEVKKKIILN